MRQMAQHAALVHNPIRQMVQLCVAHAADVVMCAMGGFYKGDKAMIQLRIAPI